MDNLEIGQWLLNVSRVSLLRFVLLINMLISGVVIKMFYLGKGGGGKERGSKITSRPTYNPLFFTKGYAREKKKEKAGEGARNKEDNQPVCS